MSDPAKNFAKCVVTGTYSSADTAITLQAGEGTKLPAPALEGAFNLVWWNYTDYPDPSGDPNKEIVRCTARTADALTVTRAQEGTSASTKNTAGKTYMMALSFTKKMYDDILQQEVYIADTAANDTYLVAPLPAYTAYAIGMRINFKATTANTGACTLNVNGLGAKDIKKDVSTSLDTGDILANQIVTVVYDGTNFQLISVISGTVTLTASQSLSNKTLTSPVINTQITGTAIATGAEVTTGTDDTQIVTPKSIGDAGLGIYKTASVATVTTEQTTTSTSYTDLTTSGASVSIATNANALVFLFCGVGNSVATANSYVGFTVSGATTVAASDAFAMKIRAVSVETAGGAESGQAKERLSATFLVTGLTIGTNIFTMKYKVNAGTGIFDNRKIIVIPI